MGLHIITSSSNVKSVTRKRLGNITKESNRGKTVIMDLQGRIVGKSDNPTTANGH